MAITKPKTHLLLDKDYLADILAPVIKQKIDRINIYPVKVYLKPKVEHVVIACEVFTRDGERLPLFVMGHSSGIKTKLYKILKFLAKYFSQGQWQVPDPIMYDKKTKALVYRELTGPNLYALFEQKQENLEPLFKSFGQWIAKMHAIGPSKIFKAHDLSMDELDPAKILNDIKKKDVALYKEIIQMIKAMARLQKKMFAKSRKRVLVHGDLHPENVILISEKPELGLIDLENASLSDREQDLGSFLEQVEIMAGHRYDKETVEQFKNIFLTSYLKAANLKLSPDMAQKILFFKSFFGLKGAIFYYRLGWFARMRTILMRVQKYIACLEGKEDYQECEI